MRHSSSTTSSSRLAKRLRVVTLSLALVSAVVWFLQLFFIISAVGRPGQNASGFDASMMLTGAVVFALLGVVAFGWGTERRHQPAAVTLYTVGAGAGLVVICASLVIMATSAG